MAIIFYPYLGIFSLHQSSSQHKDTSISLKATIVAINKNRHLINIPKVQKNCLRINE